MAIGFLLITHGRLGQSLVECAEHILSRTIDRLETIEVSRNDDPDEVLRRAEQKIAALDDGAGVLVMTDMFGGTPSNITSRLLGPGQLACIAGVSLPMLMRAITYRQLGLLEVVAKAVSGGRDGVIVMQADRVAGIKV